MKLSSIIIGLLLIEAIKTSSDRVYDIDLFKEIKIYPWEDTYFFRIPSYEDDYMQVVLDCYTINVNPGFTVRVTGFSYYPSDEEIMENSQWIYPPVPLEIIYKYTDQYWAYVYSFQTLSDKYLGISVNVQIPGYRIHMYVKALGHVYRADLLDTINLGDCFGQYYFTIPSYEKDDMRIDISVYKPYYEDVTTFEVWISGFSNINNYAEIKGSSVQWTSLPLGYMDSYSNYDTYRYPFSTLPNVNYLGFYFRSQQHFKTDIYIYSKKGAKVALIVSLVVIGLLIIAAVVTFFLRRAGVCCSVGIRIN